MFKSKFILFSVLSVITIAMSIPFFGYLILIFLASLKEKPILLFITVPLIIIFLLPIGLTLKLLFKKITSEINYNGYIWLMFSYFVFFLFFLFIFNC